jgi:hypothetical protein
MERIVRPKQVIYWPNFATRRRKVDRARYLIRFNLVIDVCAPEFSLTYNFKCIGKGEIKVKVVPVL